MQKYGINHGEALSTAGQKTTKHIIVEQTK